MDGKDWDRVPMDSGEEREGTSVLAWPPLSKAARSELFCWKMHQKTLENSTVPQKYNVSYTHNLKYSRSHNNKVKRHKWI